jgi:hypothetical protein
MRSAGHTKPSGRSLRRRNFERAMPMTVSELIKVLQSMPPTAPVALRTLLPDQAVRWDDIERIERRAPEGFPLVVLIR